MSLISPAFPTLSRTLGLLKLIINKERSKTEKSVQNMCVCGWVIEKGNTTYFISSKYDPEATNCDQVSPTILAPDGIVTVKVRTYDLASTNRILPKLA